MLLNAKVKLTMIASTQIRGNILLMCLLGYIYSEFDSLINGKAYNSL